MNFRLSIPATRPRSTHYKPFRISRPLLVDLRKPGRRALVPAMILKRGVFQRFRELKIARAENNVGRLPHLFGRVRQAGPLITGAALQYVAVSHRCMWGSALLVRLTAPARMARAMLLEGDRTSDSRPDFQRAARNTRRSEAEPSRRVCELRSDQTSPAGRRYTWAAVPLNSAAFSSAEEPAARRLQAFHKTA
jgi:hypothetical protein